MKKAIPLFLLCLLLAACAANAPEPTQAAPSAAPSAPPAAEQPTRAPTTVPTEAPVPAPVLTYTLYLPDSNAEGLLTREIQTDAINADSVLSELQKAGVLPETVIINAFGADGDQLKIDLNTSFAGYVSSMGTSGERVVIGSVVNTFLSAFQAQSVFFTIEGEILESGHVIYDFPITFVE